VDDVLAVVTDLFFQARISAAVKIAGREVRFITADGPLSPENTFRLALVDLDAGLDVPVMIRRLRAVSQSPVVAFGPHLDTGARKAARAAGADRVLAKSKFVTELPHIIIDTAGVD
jgi:hypothetical protein